MSTPADLLDEVTPDTVRHIEAALADGNSTEAKALLEALSAAGQAQVFEQISEHQRDQLVELLNRDLDPEMLAELDEDVRDDVLDQLDSKDIAAVAREMEADDAANLIEDLPEDEQAEVLAELPAEDRADIESALAYPEDSAGRMMHEGVKDRVIDKLLGAVRHPLLGLHGRLQRDGLTVAVFDHANRQREVHPLKI